jgi:hypothetical protein
MFRFFKRHKMKFLPVVTFVFYTGLDMSIKSLDAFTLCQSRNQISRLFIRQSLPSNSVHADVTLHYILGRPHHLKHVHKIPTIIKNTVRITS